MTPRVRFLNRRQRSGITHMVVLALVVHIQHDHVSLSDFLISQAVLVSCARHVDSYQ